MTNGSLYVRKLPARLRIDRPEFLSMLGGGIVCAIAFNSRVLAKRNRSVLIPDAYFDVLSSSDCQAPLFLLEKPAPTLPRFPVDAGDEAIRGLSTSLP
jgi:hypothetical protein